MRRAADSVSALTIDILVETDFWPDEPELHGVAERAAATVLSVARPRLVPDAELSLVFSDDAHMRVLNRAYRGKDAPTNVLSFPGASAGAGTYGPLLGDIVLARETVAREAADQALAFSDHLTHLIVHGFLHLLGYDHEDDAEAEVMEGLETAILARLGIADPYGGDAE
jgi:probable rRNA maturation factor